MYQAGQMVQYSERCFLFTGDIILNSSFAGFSWTRPKEARFVSIYLVGAGGGGSAGVSGTAGTTRFGGGAGGGGGTASAIFPARAIPETLWLSLMAGGQGGQTSGQSGGGAGSAAGDTTANVSYVGYRFAVTGIASSYILAAGGGAGGTTSGGGAGGSGNANSGHAIANLPSVAGIAGAARANNLAHSFVTSITTGGAGGANVSTSTPADGGNIQTANFGIANVDGGSNVVLAAGGVAGGFVDGSHGFSNIMGSIPFGTANVWYSTGGGGGASTNNGQGGNGGNGNLGSGGGGGGAGVTGLHGVGGNGGPAFCIIEWW